MSKLRSRQRVCYKYFVRKNKSNAQRLLFQFFVAVMLTTALPSIVLAEVPLPLGAQQPPTFTPVWMFYATIAVVTFSLVYGAKRLSDSLSDAKWKMSDALSEEVIEVTNGSPSTVKASDGSPQLAASSSRLLLAIGMIIMSSMYVGVGYFVLWAIFYAPERLSDFDGLGKFFISGSALFAPYAVNKLSEVFKK